jgi:fructosamine-3-kinase
MRSTVADKLAANLGSPVTAWEAVSGGDINRAYRVDLGDGRRVFVKTNSQPPPGMFESEAAGLRWLAEPGALRIPQVIAASDDYLVLEWLPPAARERDFDRALGVGLANIHAAGADHFGLAAGNYLATLAQDNQRCATWAEFYSRQRLQPLVQRAVDEQLAPKRWVGDFERLFTKMSELAGPVEAPARLHGDLWSGNVHTDERGRPCLIDPAVYGGHREIDLAMLGLFGSPSAEFYDAYASVAPLAPRWRKRISLYQLYPLLAHVCLFGASYAAQTERALHAYL